jgi:hypothetical protein
MNFNERFTEIRFKMKEKERLQSLKGRAELRKKELVERKGELQEILKKEEKDVEKLEGMSLARFVHRIKGDIDDVLFKEQQEAISAKMKYDGVCTELEMVNVEVLNAIRQMNALGNLEEQYMALIREKEEYIKSHTEHSKNGLDDIVERQAEVKGMIKELQEALYAGRELLVALENVEKSLSSAEGWGVYDMIGGGLFATMAKHSRLDEASEEINRAQSLLTRFHRELKDLGEYLDISIDIGSFLGFADYFFDGLFSDWAVQGRIHDAQDRVEDTLYRVNSLMNRMESQFREAELEFERLEKQRLALIEKA